MPRVLLIRPGYGLASGPVALLPPQARDWIILSRRLGGALSSLRNAADTPVMAESEEELKSLLMRVKGRVKKLA